MCLDLQNSVLETRVRLCILIMKDVKRSLFCFVLLTGKTLLGFCFEKLILVAELVTDQR